MADIQLKVELLNAMSGKAVYNARMKKGITREKLAGQINLSQQQIEKYEKGKNRVSAGLLFVLADLLDIPLIDIIESDDNDYMINGLRNALNDTEESKETRKNKKLLFKYFAKIENIKDQKLLCDIARLLSK